MGLPDILKKDAKAALHSHDEPEDETTEKKTEHEDATLMSLIEQGVTVEDIQVVFNNDPELLYAIGGGNCMNKLAEVADRVQGGLNGNCLQGVQRIENKCFTSCDSIPAQDGSTIRLEMTEVQSRIPGTARINERGQAMGACGGGAGYAAWETMGSRVVIDMPNAAYNRPNDKRARIEMHNKLIRLNPGVEASLDFIEDTEVRMALGNTAGGKYGHIVAKGNKYFACDGVHKCSEVLDNGDPTVGTINFNRYGAFVRVCFPTDASVSGKYVDLILAQRDARLNNPEYEYPEDVRIRKYQPTRLPQEKPQINLRTLAAQNRKNTGVRR